MRSQVKDGDLGAIIDLAVTETLERLEARRFAKAAAPRKTLAETDTAPASRHIPAAVRRAVREARPGSLPLRRRAGAALLGAAPAGVPPSPSLRHGRRPQPRQHQPDVRRPQPLPGGTRLRTGGDPTAFPGRRGWSRGTWLSRRGWSRRGLSRRGSSRHGSSGRGWSGHGWSGHGSSGIGRPGASGRRLKARSGVFRRLTANPGGLRGPTRALTPHGPPTANANDEQDSRGGMPPPLAPRSGIPPPLAPRSVSTSRFPAWPRRASRPAAGSRPRAPGRSRRRCRARRRAAPARPGTRTARRAMRAAISAP